MHLSPSLSYDRVFMLRVLREMELDVRRHTDTPCSLAPSQLPATHENLSRNGCTVIRLLKRAIFGERARQGKISTTYEVTGFCMINRRRFAAQKLTRSRQASKFGAVLQ